MVRLAPFLALLFVWPVFAQAQVPEGDLLPKADFRAPSIRFERLSLEDGLSQSTVQDIVQDEDGYMWFATRGGLNRFDGYEMKVYKPVPFDSSSLSATWVNRVHADDSGRIWAATFGGGLNVLDKSTGRFAQYRHDPNDSMSLSSDYLYSFAEGGGNLVWVGARYDGLNLLNVSTGRVERFQHDPDDSTTISGGWVRDIFRDRSGRVWIGTENGADRIDPETGNVSRILEAEGGFGRFIEDAQDPSLLWIGSANGLYRYDTRTDRYEHFLPPGPADGRQIILVVVQDPSDRDILWVGSYGGGVSRFNKRTHVFQLYRHDDRDAYSLANDHVFAVYADRSGVLWAATGDGLSSFATTGTGVTTYGYRQNDPNSLLAPTIWSVYEDRNGILWAGSDEGLDAVHRPSGRITHYRRDSTGTRGPRGAVYGIIQDRKGRYWAATNQGLAEFDPQTRRFRHYRPVPGDSTSIMHRLVGAMHEDRQGRFWVGTMGGLGLMDRETGRFTRYPNVPGHSTSMCGRFTIAIEEDHEGRLWIGTTDNGFCRFDPEGGTFVPYRHDPADQNSLSHNYVMAIQESRREPGVFWIATYGGGLNRFESRTQTFTHFDEDDGLSGDLYAVLEDENGDLWITSNSGLYQFNPVTKQVRRFDVDDGLPSNEFSQWAYNRSGSGEMFFGGIKGVVAFFPTEIRPNEIPPRTSFTGLRLDNHVVKDTMLQRAVAEIGAVTIPPGHRTVSVDFIGLHYKNPKDIRYQYRLVGFDQDWVDAGSRRAATYTNLDPGEYTLEVKAANSDGVWTPEPIKLAMMVLPPWYQSTWAYVLYGLLFFCGVVAVDRVQRRRLVRRERRKAQAKELEQARELKQAYTQLEQSQGIVRAINVETGLEALLKAVLDQTKVIPGVEKASALVYDEDADVYVVKASEGWDAWQVRSVRMTPEEAAARYTDQAEEVVEDIFLERDVAARPTFAGMEELETPASMMVMRIRSGDRTDGYIVFDNMRDRDAFADRDVSLLVNLREHVRSAFLKARLLENLQRSLAELKSTQDQLVQQEKLASLGSLTAGIAHEIKNPLNFVNNFAGLSVDLLDETREVVERLDGRIDDENLEELRALLEDLRVNAEKIEQHGRRADAIVHSMLQHSRGASGERRSTDVNALLDEYVNLAYHGRRAQDGAFACEIERAFDLSLGDVRLAPQEIGRVVVNLLQNAFDAVHDCAASAGDGFTPRVRISTARVDGQAVIEVTDNGGGIPPGKEAAIFEPFFTTKPTGRGTGLGLSLSHDIVTKGHGGSLRVENRAGEGATFIIRLPA